MFDLRPKLQALKYRFFPENPDTPLVVRMEGCPLPTATRFIQDIANLHQVHVTPFKTWKWRNPCATFGVHGNAKDLEEFQNSFDIINAKIQHPLRDAHHLPPVQWQEQALVWVAHSRAFHRKLLRKPQFFKSLFIIAHSSLLLGILGMLATPWLAFHHHARWDLPLISGIAIAGGWKIILDLRFVYKAPRDFALREMQHRRLT